MPSLELDGFSQYYELQGSSLNTPVLMITGLGGVGTSWGRQPKLLSERYHVILPDHRGVGQSTHTLDGHNTQQLAADMAALVEYLGVGPVHVIGTSTGGAIAQYMALNHPDTVRSLTLSSTFARFDAFTHREFAIRRKMAAEWNRPVLVAAYALFLFSARYTRNNPDAVQSWIDRAAGHPEQPIDREIALKRIDMIAAHDAFARLGEIRQPTLVLCGDHNVCTPLPLSEELAESIPGAELVLFLEAGELIELEQAERFFQVVSDFLQSIS